MPDPSVMGPAPPTPAEINRRGMDVEAFLRNLDPTSAAALGRKRYVELRFITRARTLFYARLAFLSIGLGVLAIPGWSVAFGIRSLWAFAVYFGMVAYSVASYLVLDRPRASRIITFVTLCCDLLVMVYLIAASGGLGSPLLATELMFTMLFVILFPKPLAILPPLLTLPIVAQIDQLLWGHKVAVLDLFVLLWYSAINFIIVYVMVYLNEREQAQHEELVVLQDGLKELAVVEERNRLAREIHDGLGASLSSLIIQAEYLEQLGRSNKPDKTETLVQEIRELKGVAEESIDELRRNISMMRDDFELLSAVEDYCRTWESRSKLPVHFEHLGRPPELPSEVSLTLFRVLQECLTNATRHASASEVKVRLSWVPPKVALHIDDDGQGFEAEPTLKGHYGLLNMRERAKNVGGSLEIESSAGQGTRVRFEASVREPEWDED